MQRLFLLPVVLIGLQAAPAAAQDSPRRGGAGLQPPSSESLVPFAPPLARTAAQSPSLKQRIGRMFLGGLVGGWSGYFASHVAVSDWEDRTGLGSHRSTWAAAGLVLGVAAGHLLGGGSGGAPPEITPSLTAARSIVTREEIVASGALNAYELLRSARKEWLMPRGINSFTESARGRADDSTPLEVVPGDDHILVYLDNSRLGGTQYLEEISLGSIEKIEFIEPAAATFRWGTGHAHGVILFTTMGAKPPQS